LLQGRHLETTAQHHGAFVKSLDTRNLRIGEDARRMRRFRSERDMLVTVVMSRQNQGIA